MLQKAKKGILLAVGIAIMVIVASLLFMQWQTSAQPLSFDIKRAFGKDNLVPILVIGSGVAGLDAAARGGSARKHTVVITGAEPGGALTKTTSVKNWPAVQQTTGQAIIDQLWAQAKAEKVEFLEDSVEKVDFSTWPYVVYTKGGYTLNALTVIIATGAESKKLGIPGEKVGNNYRISVCAICDAHMYEGLDVVVVGGGDAAIVQALQLSPHAQQVTILVRKDSMRALASEQEKLAEYPNIKVMYNTEIKEIFGDGLLITGITLYNNKTGQMTQMPIDGVFLAIGHTPRSEIFKDWVKTDASGLIVLKERSQQTSLPGVFAAGDVEDPYRQADIAAGHGKAAALDAETFLHAVGFTKSLEEQLAPSFFVPEGIALEEINDPTDLDRVLRQESALTVLYFSSKTCPTCKSAEVIIKAAAKKYGPGVRFLKVSVDDNPAMAPILERYEVETTPRVRVIRNGNLVGQLNQDITSQEPEQMIARLQV